MSGNVGVQQIKLRIECPIFPMCTVIATYSEPCAQAVSYVTTKNALCTLIL
jgi:hypothetical protein